MRSLWTKACLFVRSEEGPTVVEYAILLALILLVCLTAIRTFGTATSTSFSNSAQSLAS